MTGGDLVAEVLVKHGVRFLFTLCGGHISPILVCAKARGIRVVDVRDEATAAFAADAVARLTGVPGVAAVTAGPGVTNTITAIKNAQLAQSPLVLLGGATGTILKGRGSLQDIDQMALFAPHVKWLQSVSRVRDLAPAVHRAFDEALDGVPGPVFVECPVDLLYEEKLVRKIYGVGEDARRTLRPGKMVERAYLKRHLGKLFRGAGEATVGEATPPPAPLAANANTVRKVARALRRARRPVALIGSQAVLISEQTDEVDVSAVDAVAAAVSDLRLPVYLSGMARGLLGHDDPQQLRHKRRKALKAADLVLLAGVPCDFRLDYGRHIGHGAKLVSVNLSAVELKKNRRPDIGILADPGSFLQALAVDGAGRSAIRWQRWHEELTARDRAREEEIATQAAQAPSAHINPLHLCREIEKVLDDDSVLVADGGDFVGTASYIVRPRGPLRWLDPGVFGTLGVGGGFALGAKLSRPGAEVWLLYGDGSSAYSLAEIDTMARHGLPVIAVIGNDAGWTQIAREQVEFLGDDCGTVLRHTDYHRVAEGYGGKGFLLERAEDIPKVLAAAKEAARAGAPVVINALLGKTDFRKGSLSM